MKAKYIDYTCMLLYLLKVLKQRGQENWVGPIKICAGVGIQYWPLLSLFGENPAEATVTSTSLSDEISGEESLEIKSADTVLLGSPKCKATVTVSSSLLSCSSTISAESLASLLFGWSASMALK